MEIVSGVVAIIFVGAFVWWRQKKDREVYGLPTKQDRWRTVGLAAFFFLLFLCVAYLGRDKYILVTLAVFILYQIVGVGVGKRGWYRQTRDGLFLGWVAAFPVSIFWFSNYANT